MAADFIEAAQEQRKRLLERLMQQDGANQAAAAKVLSLLSAGRPSGSRSQMRPFVPFARPRLIAPGLMQALGVVNNRIAGPTVTPAATMANPQAPLPPPAFQNPGTPTPPPGNILPPTPLGGGAQSTSAPAGIMAPVMTTQDYIRRVNTPGSRVGGGRFVF